MRCGTNWAAGPDEFSCTDLPNADVIWGVRAVWAWSAWSAGDHAEAARECDLAIAEGRLDPAYWFACFPAYVRVGYAERMADYCRLLREVGSGDPRGRVCTAVPQPFDLVGNAEQPGIVVAWAEQALDIATTAGFRSGIANGHHMRGAALPGIAPPVAADEFRLTIEVASAINPDHFLVEAGLAGLAQVTVFHGELSSALQASRDSIASATRYRYLSNVAISLQYAAVALARRERSRRHASSWTVSASTDIASTATSKRR